MKFKLFISLNPYGWYFAEFSEISGKRITSNDVDENLLLDREDVQINKYGVVLFYDSNVANIILRSLQ